MPEFLERDLKREYGAKSKIPYKIMNAEGLMRGSKETAKGRAMERKHEREMNGTGASLARSAVRASTSSHIDHAHHNVKNAKGHSEKLRHA